VSRSRRDARDATRRFTSVDACVTARAVGRDGKGPDVEASDDRYAGWSRLACQRATIPSGTSSRVTT
jgi:hypothetical protein